MANIALMLAMTMIIFVGAQTTRANAQTAGDSASFRDCNTCPEMVVVPAGSFLMGADRGRPAELPVRRVVIPRAFAMSKFEITFDEWAACVAAGGWRKGSGRP